jgi:hypothetical protein
MRRILWTGAVGLGACSAPVQPAAEPTAMPTATIQAGNDSPAVPTKTAAPAPASPRADPDPPASAPQDVVYSTNRLTWVYEAPSVASRKLGYLGVGVAVALRERGLQPPSDRCKGGFYAVQPAGFVCASQNVTNDPSHPVVAAVREVQGEQDRAYPFRYGLSLGAPMYNKLPDRKTHATVMMRYPSPRKRLGDWAKSFLDMDAGESIRADSEVPSFLRDGKSGPNATNGWVRRSIPHSSLLSYTLAFEHDGRVWLLAADFSIVPADRIVPFRRTTFRGVELVEGQRLPLAWACRAQREKLRMTATGDMERTGQSWSERQQVPLSGRATQVHRIRYLEAADGTWMAASNLCEARQVNKLPDGVGTGDRWIYLSMMEDTLVAYRGLQPVYATLHSPGRGGSHHGKGDVRQYTTPLGSFFINWKERWATLSPDPGAPASFWISDVPGVQYFAQPYALHGAYWHEKFGTPMSAGCPNLAPADAVWLLDFTDPPLPDGWQAIGPARGQNGTMVVVGP